MARTFAYARVSTLDQSTDNQLREIEAAGFKIEAKRIVEETVSGSSAAEQRAGFTKLLERMEDGDTLIVTKLDRLGRNAIDVMQTVKRLEATGIRVVCLALGGVDLTSSAGKMTMTVLAAVAQFERDLLIERTLSGQARAKAAGVKFGRPPALANGEQAKVLEQLAAGETISAIARSAGTSRATILRLKTAQKCRAEL
jgi:putative DNA-invertase from lambdoid prophage Rac